MEQYKSIFCEMFHLDENFNPETIIRNEIDDWDSVGHISLITQLEEVYDILFETEDILEFTSYNKGIEILKKYGAV